eukprot:312824-Rhodomonas_salina.2
MSGGRARLAWQHKQHLPPDSRHTWATQRGSLARKASTRRAAGADRASRRRRPTPDPTSGAHAGDRVTTRSFSLRSESERTSVDGVGVACRPVAACALREVGDRGAVGSAGGSCGLGDCDAAVRGACERRALRNLTVRVPAGVHVRVCGERRSARRAANSAA